MHHQKKWQRTESSLNDTQQPPPCSRNRAALPPLSWWDSLAITGRQRCPRSCWRGPCPAAPALPRFPHLGHQPPLQAARHGPAGTPPSQTQKKLPGQLPRGFSQPFASPYLRTWIVLGTAPSRWLEKRRGDRVSFSRSLQDAASSQRPWAARALLLPLALGGSSRERADGCGCKGCWRTRCSSTHFLCPLL